MALRIDAEAHTPCTHLLPTQTHKHLCPRPPIPTVHNYPLSRPPPFPHTHTHTHVGAQSLVVVDKDEGGRVHARELMGVMYVPLTRPAPSGQDQGDDEL